MTPSNQHSERRDGRCPSCGLSPYERGIGDADISRIVAERNRLQEQLESYEKVARLLWEYYLLPMSEEKRAFVRSVLNSNPASEPKP